MNRDKFWIVWSPQGMTPPRVRHLTPGIALRAAENMASLHPAQEFYVMEAVSMSRKVTVQTVKLDGCAEEEIPF